MRALRENFVPVAILAVWMAASAYTIGALATMRPTRVIEASMDVTVTAPVHTTARLGCPDTPAPVTAGT